MFVIELLLHGWTDIDKIFLMCSSGCEDGSNSELDSLQNVFEDSILKIFKSMNLMVETHKNNLLPYILLIKCIYLCSHHIYLEL